MVKSIFLTFNFLLIIILSNFLYNIDFKQDNNSSKYKELTCCDFSQNLIFEETFENETIWENVGKQFAEQHSFSIVSHPVFLGQHSGKFELRFGDKKATKNGLRSEVLFPRQTHNERWYSFAVYFPSIGYKDDMDTELFTQWHNGQGSPTANFRVKDGRLNFRIGFNRNIPTARWNQFDFGPVPKDIWTEFVFHFIHSSGQDGLVEIWKNGDKILTHKGPNRYPNSEIPRWKVGIYKSVWEHRETNVNLRVIYFDNVRMGNENATYEDMTSLKLNLQ